jgi:hypothetical protein
MTFAKQIAQVAALGAALLLGLSAPSAQAGYVVMLTQQGSNVVASGSGTLDLTGLTLTITGDTSQSGIFPAGGLINTGPTTATPVDLYNGTIGTTSFGSGSFIPASSGSGDPVNIQGSINNLVVPAGYVSDSRTLSDTATYDNATFASLGVTPGTYTWTWGSDGPNQKFTLQIGSVPAPPIGRGLPVLLAVVGILFAAKLWERGKGRRVQFG